ncbi:Oidioi.mRNA.OKI2018_I69.PAR.g8555.t1.cds [Oikopleura dioica]|uniref:Oidioi.mRNA.OKI2018_I69.PAR.g8555.t1.cds n=1 Tax=Oikopleura dioica TaxID=34765 RepID=A0ABN7RGI0_OIKDI|nr:Oidioi.mRNA.OKI2018_I69.PAR.g8555.t1.cds [Oikopleura dioica]
MRLAGLFLIGQGFGNSIENVTCSATSECAQFFATCENISDGTGNCQCASIASFELVEVDPPQDIGGTLYSHVCKQLSPCEKLQIEQGECPLHSNCKQRQTESGQMDAFCECHPEFVPSDPSASAEVGIDGVTCERVDVCEDYDCSSVTNSGCVARVDEPECLCESNFDSFKEVNGTWEKMMGDDQYFPNTEISRKCVAKVPCFDVECGFRQVCVREEVNGIPSGMCACEQGYKDGSKTSVSPDNKLTLICKDVDECSNEALNNCAAGQDCTNSEGSFSCSCSPGWLPNSDPSTNVLVPCIQCSGPHATEFEGTCTCAGPAQIHDDDASICDCPSSMALSADGESCVSSCIHEHTVLENGQCVCDPSKNMTWNDDLARCGCSPGFVRSILGDCRLPEENYLSWGKAWQDNCKNGKRSRAVFSITPRKKLWFQILPSLKERISVEEDCGNSTAKCTDWNAIYDETTGFCRCKDGFFDSKQGCIPWTPFEANTVIVAELKRRMGSLFNSTELVHTFTPKKKQGIDRFLVKTAKRMFDPAKEKGKLKKSCSKKSLILHGNAPDEIESIFTEFNVLKNKPDGDVSVVEDLARVFDRFQRLYTWNCPETGYGKYPLNPTHETDVVCQTREDQKNFLKCQLHYRFDRLVKDIAPTNPIDW